ncbi:hypothetical protein CCACVL1_20986 [Corchorus capsularis]|uniref:Uncharacterized protein n=1 Tax=Corchorus capsularis TaxID=210143 RepID=A0A1R3H8Z7_COCAP|nr:hypothetical protein CCACVL1_20986 [Corchorus capsularis]
MAHRQQFNPGLHRNKFEPMPLRILAAT